MTPLQRTVTLDGPVAYRSTLGVFQKGRSDPTARWASDGFWKTTRTPAGTATVRIRPTGQSFEVTVWGAGAASAADRVPDWLGAHDTEPLVTDHERVAEWTRRNPGLRIGRSGEVFHETVVAVCGQKVTAVEAKRAWRGIVERYGEPAPGPADLLVVPTAERLAQVPYFELHQVGLEKRRADVVVRVARAADRLERIVDGDRDAAIAVLCSIHGIGEWTANEVTLPALGDTDAVSVGDFHLKNGVAWALAGRERGTDDEMVALLEEFRPHRAKVVRLIGAMVGHAPRRGPRLTPRRIQRH